MSINVPWAGATVVAAGAAGLVAGAVAGAGLVAEGFAVVLGAGVCANTGAAIRKLRAAKAAGRDKRIRTLLQALSRQGGLLGTCGVGQGDAADLLHAPSVPS